MAKKDDRIYYDEDGFCYCKNCKKRYSIIRFPELHKIGSLVYARCTCCDRYDPYEFVGANKRGVMLNWNDVMLHNDQEHCFKEKTKGDE